MKTKTILTNCILAIAISTLGIFAAHNVQAGTIYKAGSGTDLTAGANWVGSMAPGAGDTAAWGGSSLGAGLTLGSATSWNGIWVTNAASNIDISGAGALTLGGGGIDLSASVVNLSITNDIALNADQAWVVNSGQTLTSAGAISGGSVLNISGVSYSYGSYLPATPTTATAFSGASLANVTSVSGTVGGGYVSNPGPATSYFYGNDGTTATVQLQWYDGVPGSQYVKCVKIGLTNSGGNIVATVLYARYSSIQGSSAALGTSFDTLGGTYNITAGTIATSAAAGGYGCSGLTIKMGASGTGTVVLSGTNTYTGGTIINAGTLTIGGAGQLGSGNYSANLTDNAAFDNNSSATQELSGIISGSGTVTQSGSGTLTLSGVNTYTGNTAISAGTLEIRGSGQLGGGSYAPAITVNSGAKLQYASSAAQTFAGGISGGGTLQADGSGALTLYAGAYLMNYTVNLTGAGPVTLNGSGNFSGLVGDMSGYSGTMTITGTTFFNNTNGNNGSASAKFSESSGAIWLVSNEDGANTKTVNLGELSGSGTIAGAAYSSTRTGTKTLSIGALGTSTTYSGVIQDQYSGAGSVVALTKVGNGSLTISGSNTYTGGMKLNAGTLNIQNATALGATASTLTIAGGSLDTSTAGISMTANNAQNWNGDFTFTGTGNLNLGAGAVSMNASRQVTVTANTLTVGGAISGSTYGLTKAGAGTLTLSGANTYTGNTTISAGTLALSTAGSIATSPNIIVASGATFDMSGLTTALTLTGGQALKAGATGANTTGTLALGANGLTLSAGGLAFTALGNANTTAPLTLSGSTTLALNGAPVTVTTTADLPVGTYTLIAAGGTATVTGTPGTLVVNGSYVSTGKTASVSAATGSLVLTVAPASATISTSGSLSAFTTTYGSASASQSGVTISGANLTANITAAAPVGFELSLDGSTWSGSGGSVVFVQSGGTLNIATLYVRMAATNSPVSGNYNSQNIVLSSTGATSVNVPTASSGNSITAKALTVASISAANKMYDGTTNAAVTGQLQTAEAFGSGSSSDNQPYTGDTLTLASSGYGFSQSAPGAGLTVGGGSFTLGGGSAGNYTLTQPALTTTASILTTAVWTSTAASGSWTNSPNWLNNLVGTGTDNTADFTQVSMTQNQAVTLDGARTIGNLLFADLSGNSNSWTLNPGSAGPLTLAVNSGAPVISNGVSTTIGAVVAGTQGLTKNGNGTLSLSAANTYTGATTINGGTLNLTMGESYSGSHVGSSVVINSGGTLELNAKFQTGFAYGFSAAIAPANITVNAGGTFNKNSQATYIENLTMNGNGVIIGPGPVSGSDDLQMCANLTATSTAAGAPTISTINLVAGTYTDAGNTRTINVTHDPGSTSAVDLTIGAIGQQTSGPGANMVKAGAGTLALTNTCTYTGTTTISAGTLALNGGGSLTSTNISVATNATFDVSGVSGGSYALNGSDTLTLNIAKSGASLSQGQVVATSLTAGGTLTVSASGDALADGDTFTLFNVQPGGTFAVTNLPVTGSGANWWTTNNYQTLTYNVWPTAGNASYTHTKGLTLKILISDLLTNVTGAVSGKTITLASVGSSANANGATVQISGGYVVYTPATSDANDSFTYTVSDGRGGTATGTVYVIADTSALFGQQAQLTADSSGNIQVKFYGVPGYTYIVQRSPDLSTWTDISTNTATTSNPVISISDAIAPSGQAYYRLEWQP